MKKKRAVLCLFAACVLAVGLWVSPGGETPVSASADGGIYESFDDYDTAFDRDGEAGGIYEQIVYWSKTPATFSAEAGDPVGTEEGKSLRVTQKGNRAVDIWPNGTKDPEKLDQTGATYVKVNVRNLSKTEKELGFYLTNILQSTIDGWANSGNSIPDNGQEHFSLKWNKPVVFETPEGETSVVKSVSGSTVAVPAGFVGSISIPLDNDWLKNPDWWLAEGHEYGTGKLDLSRMFLVGFHLPETTNISSAEPDTWTVFEFDEVRFCTDGHVKEILDEEQTKDAASAEEKIRPTTSRVTVDFKNFVITVAQGTTLKEFCEMFSLPAGYELVVHTEDGFDVTEESDVLKNGYEVVFTDEQSPFSFRLALSGGTTPRRGCGCGGSGGTAVALLAAAGVIALAARRLLR